MRLLHTSTLEVEYFLQSTPKYVILSHTWGEEEVSLQDIQSGSAPSKKGYAKITACCKKAAEDGFSYCWIDTCCIDKTSSAELSESINSMYMYYKNSSICYAYIADFDIERGHSPSLNDINAPHGLGSQRWFSRGWTLQELIAPPIVEFYDVNWKEFGTRLSLQQQLTAITGISKFILQGGDPAICKIAVRMSWAAKRKTTRIEDEAYCLMGLFSVNMPLLYGEGSRAFRRLQEEILRVEEDYTIFAWAPKESLESDDALPAVSRGLLAHSPSDFAEFRAENHTQAPLMSPLWPLEDLSRDHFSIFPPSVDQVPPYLTSRGLRITLPVTLVTLQNNCQDIYACLTLIYPPGGQMHMLCVKLIRATASEERYIRQAGVLLVVLPQANRGHFEYRSIYVEQPHCLHSGPPPWDIDNAEHQASSFDLSLLVVKLKANFALPATFNTISAVNSDAITHLRYSKQTSASDPTTREIVDAISSNIELNYHGVNELTYSFDPVGSPGHGEINFVCNTITPPPRYILTFAFANHPTTTFKVSLNIPSGTPPTCTALSTSPSYARLHAQWHHPSSETLGSLHKTDRVTLYVDLEDSSPTPSPSPSPTHSDSDKEKQKDKEKGTEVPVTHIQVDISIRRIAPPSPHLFSQEYETRFQNRFELSIELKDVTPRGSMGAVGVNTEAALRSKAQERGEGSGGGSGGGREEGSIVKEVERVDSWEQISRSGTGLQEGGGD
ncbi:hypothetical protein N0V83_001630 [Neocucurbitaria cava]|uniref:Heterokaryon incompatibility domain-containing protein n=1 Tax=Neocucurbitaria cava TaxID=798079 RepID=A0A9W8YGL4_9PLEO|nr:hypothetical protein N0V83_001630 [Neocucurbitaria cava]